MFREPVWYGRQIGFPVFGDDSGAIAPDQSANVYPLRLWAVRPSDPPELGVPLGMSVPEPVVIAEIVPEDVEPPVQFVVEYLAQATFAARPPVPNVLTLTAPSVNVVCARRRDSSPVAIR